MFWKESPDDTPVKLLIGVEVLPITPALVVIAFAAIAHWRKWDLVLAKYRYATKFVVASFRHGNASDELPAQH